jgi:hypothetical protein
VSRPAGRCLTGFAPRPSRVSWEWDQKTKCSEPPP